MSKDIKDFFISYNKADKQWAKWVAGTLEENGFTTLIQAWDFKPGNNFILKMQEAISNTKKTIIILSSSYLSSEYCQAEWAAAYNISPTGEKRVLIPIRVEDIEPTGLLSDVIYIDLFQSKEKEAIRKLLNGVGNSENPRTKPNFPLYKSTELNDGNCVQIHNFEFDFELDENRILKDYSTKTKNNLMQWYCDGEENEFTITIKDSKVSDLNEELEGIREKIKMEQVLTPEEENKYEENIRLVKMLEFENTIKKKAISFFLKDQGMQGYLQITNYRSLENIINNILNYNYFDQNKYSDPKYVMLDIFLDPIPKECHDHFIICVEREKVIENFGDCTMYALIGADVCGLNKELLSEAVTGFYIFLADEVIKYNNIDLTNNKKILNLLSYKVGMH